MKPLKVLSIILFPFQVLAMIAFFIIFVFPVLLAFSIPESKPFPYERKNYE